MPGSASRSALVCALMAVLLAVLGTAVAVPAAADGPAPAGIELEQPEPAEVDDPEESAADHPQDDPDDVVAETGAAASASATGGAHPPLDDGLAHHALEGLPFPD